MHPNLLSSSSFTGSLIRSANHAGRRFTTKYSLSNLTSMSAIFLKSRYASHRWDSCIQSPRSFFSYSISPTSLHASLSLQCKVDTPSFFDLLSCISSPKSLMSRSFKSGMVLNKKKHGGNGGGSGVKFHPVWSDPAELDDNEFEAYTANSLEAMRKVLESEIEEPEHDETMQYFDDGEWKDIKSFDTLRHIKKSIPIRFKEIGEAEAEIDKNLETYGDEDYDDDKNLDYQDYQNPSQGLVEEGYLQILTKIKQQTEAQQWRFLHEGDDYWAKNTSTDQSMLIRDYLFNLATTDDEIRAAIVAEPGALEHLIKCLTYPIWPSEHTNSRPD